MNFKVERLAPKTLPVMRTWPGALGAARSTL